SSSVSMRYRSSRQVMIFVIRFLLFVAGPDDQSLSCGPRESSSSGKGLSEAALSGSNQEKKREGHCRRVVSVPPLVVREAVVRAESSGMGAWRQARPRARLWSGLEKV